ncbi:hypothetical protein WN51_10037, partial [Melipona quadrifasciata]
TSPMYLSEVVDTEIRGALGILTAVNVLGPRFRRTLGVFGRKKDAYKSIAYFKGTTNYNELKRKMEFIYKVLGRDNSLKLSHSSEMNRQSWLDKLRLIKQPSNRRALCIVILLPGTIATTMVEKVGRRKLLITSMFGSWVTSVSSRLSSTI